MNSKQTTNYRNKNKISISNQCLISKIHWWKIIIIMIKTSSISISTSKMCSKCFITKICNLIIIINISSSNWMKQSISNPKMKLLMYLCNNKILACSYSNLHPNLIKKFSMPILRINLINPSLIIIWKP